jgi:hypothetical protein
LTDSPYPSSRISDTTVSISRSMTACRVIRPSQSLWGMRESEAHRQSTTEHEHV